MKYIVISIYFFVFLFIFSQAAVCSGKAENKEKGTEHKQDQGLEDKKNNPGEEKEMIEKLELLKNLDLFMETDTEMLKNLDLFLADS